MHTLLVDNTLETYLIVFNAIPILTLINQLPLIISIAMYSQHLKCKV